jgi:arylsulfatase A
MKNTKQPNPRRQNGLFRGALNNYVKKISGFSLGSLVALTTSFASQQPNIVVLLADDLGYGEVQALNPEFGKIKTPALDQLIGEGMTFTDAHSGSSVCTPTRYGLMTGRYAWRTRLQRHVLTGGESLIAQETLTIAEMLKQQGYDTVMIGKWHLGMMFDGVKTIGRGQVKVGAKVSHGPIDFGGFDQFFGFHHAGQMDLWIEDVVMTENLEAVEMLPKLTQTAVNYIESRKGSDTPFFMYIPWNAPHSPVVPSAAWEGKSGINAHADFVMQTDNSYGQVIQALKDNGFFENTLVICSSDNGTSPTTSGQKQLAQAGHRSSAGFRGMKADIWEGGHRVPFIVSWPGEVAAGSRSDALVCLTDVMATAAELTDYTMQEDDGVDSFSFLSVLRGEANKSRQDVIHHSINGSFAIREKQWKLACNPGSGGWAAPNDQKQLAINGRESPLNYQLYDMTKDPEETTNLSAQYPEVVERLRQQLQSQIDAGRTTAGVTQLNDAAIKVDKWATASWVVDTNRTSFYGAGTTHTVEGSAVSFGGGGKYTVEGGTVVNVTDKTVTTIAVPNNDFYLSLNPGGAVSTYRYAEVFYSLGDDWTGGGHQLLIDTTVEDPSWDLSPGNHGIIPGGTGTHSILIDLTTLDGRFSGDWTQFRWDFFNVGGNGNKTFTLDKVVFASEALAVSLGPVASLGGADAYSGVAQLASGQQTGSSKPNAEWPMEEAAPSMTCYLVPGKSGNALWLNGSNNLLGKGLGKYADLSLSFWFKPARIHPNGNTLIHTKNGPGALKLSIREDTHLVLNVNGWGNVVSDRPLSTRYGWHHLSLVADGRAGVLRLYVDGQPTGEIKSANSVPVSLQNFLVGAGFNVSASPRHYASARMNDNLQGLVDELRIWNRGLSPAEIYADMDTSESAVEAGLVASWTFDATGDFPEDDPEGYWGKRWRLASATDPLMRMIKFENIHGGSHPLGMPQVRDYSPVLKSDLGGFPEHGDGMGVILNRIPQPLPESVSGFADLLTGNFKYVDGVVGQALKFDGVTTCAVRHPSKMPDLTTGITLDAWIAPQEYSLNQTAIINQYSPDRKSGFFFGLNESGKLVLGASFDGEWKEVVSDSTVPQLKWSHVIGAVDPAGRLSIYLNGRAEGTLDVHGAFAPAEDMVCVIGESMQRMRATHDHNHPYTYGMEPRMVFDGLIDELKIHNRPLSNAEIALTAAAVVPANPTPLKMRKFPELPKGPKPFGAYYAKLNYSPEWDAMHRSGDYADVVVQFDNSPVKLVFWKGANYIPALVSENGLWMSDQALEMAGPVGSCSEAIVDAQSRYSHVRVIENTPARVVVHWRSALPRSDYVLANEDQNGWNDWVDEYWTVYPDGVCVRKQVLMTSRVVLGIPFVETIMFNQPGMYPWDTVEWSAVTVGDMEGNQADWTWSKEFGGPPRHPDWNKGAAKVKTMPIQRVNLRSRYKPYTIWFPTRRTGPWSEPRGANKDVMFPYSSWSHWPVQQVQSDGIDVMVPDRPTHTSLTGGDWDLEPSDRPDSFKNRVLYGMTDQPFEALIPLAKSWNYPPEVVMDEVPGFMSQGYDKYQRAYVFDCAGLDTHRVAFELAASEGSPLYNPAFVLKNWGGSEVKILLNGKEIPSGNHLRIGHVNTLESSDLILWIEYDSKEPASIELVKQ